MVRNFLASVIVVCALAWSIALSRIVMDWFVRLFPVELAHRLFWASLLIAVVAFMTMAAINMGKMLIRKLSQPVAS